MKKAKTPKDPSQSMGGRMVVLVFLFFAFAVYVLVTLYNLSVTNYQYYAEKANSTHFQTITISANRGSIYDANGTALAWSATVYKIFIDPTQFQKEMDSYAETMENYQASLNSGGTLPDGVQIVSVDDYKQEIANFLAEELEIEVDEILSAMELENQYYVLQTQVSKNVVDEIEEYVDALGLSSICSESDTKRYYPQNELAAHVVGFTNSDGDGQYGLEYYYNDELSGTDGRTITAVDATQSEVPYRNSTTYDAQDGNDLYLTIDSTLQYYLEKNLQQMCEDYEVQNRACGIIMNCKTGAIYAMATYPSYDLNDPSTIYDETIASALLAIEDEDEYTEAYIEARETQWKNKAVTERYIPGSVFKAFTSSAAIEEGLLDPWSETFTCEGTYTVLSTEIHCHRTSGHGLQTFSEALTNSCNPTFIEVGLRLGVNLFRSYCTSFGLLETTGIDLPSEATSIFISESVMGQVELASSAFGQTNKLTPLQMITGLAAVVNGGYLLQPYLVSKIVSSDGNVVSTTSTTIRRQVISEETSATMRELLQAVVDDNGGGNAYIKGYSIGGKSGTSQKLDEYDEDNMQYVASYMCFAPADDPEIIMLIIADEPNTEIGYYGSVVCAPYARAILEEALPYLGYYPEYTEEEYAELDVTVPLLVDYTVSEAQALLEERGLQCVIKGSGDTVVKQCPTTGSSVSSDGTVIIYTENSYVTEIVSVPDLTGYTASDASAVLANLGLNYSASGASASRTDVLVQTQSIEPGTQVEIGTVITLTLVVNDQSG